MTERAGKWGLTLSLPGLNAFFAGWACLAGIIGGPLGGIVGHGLGGAIICALLLAGLVAIPLALLRPAEGMGSAGTPSSIWVEGGAAAGLVV